MPSDHGRRFDEYQGIEELRSHSVEPHPEQTVGEEQPKAPPEKDNLMSQGDELKLQRCAAADAEREQGNESGQNRDHAPGRYGGGAGNYSISLDSSQF
jgi:hypothetical protein